VFTALRAALRVRGWRGRYGRWSAVPPALCSV